MVIGALPESDYQIMSVAESLYDKFSLKRVYYSAFVNVNEEKDLPALAGGPPLLREHRLYQADWLLRFYDFKVDELLTADRPNFNTAIDPKADWAVRHLECFPVEDQPGGLPSALADSGRGRQEREADRGGETVRQSDL